MICKQKYKKAIYWILNNFKYNNEFKFLTIHENNINWRLYKYSKCGICQLQLVTPVGWRFHILKGLTRNCNTIGALRIDTAVTDVSVIQQSVCCWHLYSFCITAWYMYTCNVSVCSIHIGSLQIYSRNYYTISVVKLIAFSNLIYSSGQGNSLRGGRKRKLLNTHASSPSLHVLGATPVSHSQHLLPSFLKSFHISMSCWSILEYQFWKSSVVCSV